jgi:hypothetical protein
VTIKIPAADGIGGDYVFAAAFIRSAAPRGFVRGDGLPVEASNVFSIE